MAHKITVAHYLLQRLHELGVKHVFGVPGDYNLLLLDHIVNHSELEWVGNCNELNGAYACDAYARMKGIAAMVTTYGVGELSAVNGIAGSFAERVPVVKIVGVPATQLAESKALMHHTTGEGKYNVFADMYKHVTHVQTLLTAANAGAEIDSALTECWLRKRPVYVAIPTDVVNVEIDAPAQPLSLSYPASDSAAVSECVEKIYSLLAQADKAVVLVDVAADRYHMQDLILGFLAASGLPFATMSMAKGLLDETHLQFIGLYCGDISAAGVQKRVEESDCLLSFGQFLTDLNSGGFSAHVNYSVSIEVNCRYTEVQHALYREVNYLELIPALTEKIKAAKYRFAGTLGKKAPEKPLPAATQAALTQKRFWEIVEAGLASQTETDSAAGLTVVSDIGTSSFGSTFMALPANTKYISQTLWSSIGYSVGALLGACIADPTRQALLFVGDGSFQLTAQEISTIMRHNLTPLIFLINNDGYTIERYVHAPEMKYQEIKRWNYSELPKVFGENCISLKITTEEQLSQVVDQYFQVEERAMYFVEVEMEKMDGPAVMKKFFKL